MTTKLISIVHKLRIAKGSLEKLDILEQHKDNELWKRFLIATLNDSISYHTGVPKNSTNFDEVAIDSVLFNGLDKLAYRQVAGKEAREITHSLSERYGEIARLILGRSLKAGTSIGLVNKAYPKLIEVFESFKGKDCPIDTFPVYSSIKFDGVKIFVYVSITGVILCTSSGIEFKLDSLIEQFKDAEYGVYEGEMIHDQGRQVDRPVITGKLNSLLAGTISDITDYRYCVYDYIPLEEWHTKQGVLTFDERLSHLKDSKAIDKSYIVYDIPQYTHNNIEEVTEFFNGLIEHGYEGSMHRYDKDIYEWMHGDKRSDKLIKKKSIRECVLTCTGTIPHSNQSKAITGSLICSGDIVDKYAGEVYVEVDVGSGLSKYDTQLPEERYKGEEIEVIYNSVTMTEKGNSLFLPRFKRIVK